MMKNSKNIICYKCKKAIIKGEESFSTDEFGREHHTYCIEEKDEEQINCNKCGNELNSEENRAVVGSNQLGWVCWSCGWSGVDEGVKT